MRNARTNRTSAPTLRPAIALVLAIAWTHASTAIASVTCSERFAQLLRLNRRWEGNVISPAAQAKIDALVADMKLSDRDRAKQIFDVFFEEQIAILPPKFADRLRRARDKAVIRNPTTTIGARWSPLTEGVTVHLPPQLQGTILHFTFLAHELEHGVQQATTGIPFKRFNPIETFNKEKGAMVAEWQYASLFPLHDRVKLGRAIVTDTSLDEHSRDFALVVLNLPEDSRQAYLDVQHRIGRYSMAAIEQDLNSVPPSGIFKRIFDKALPSFVIVVGSCYGLQKSGYPSSTSKLKSYCDQILDF